MTFEQIFNDYWEWAKMFDTSAEEACNGVIKEAMELQDCLRFPDTYTDMEKRMEVADVFMYIMYVAKKSGMELPDIIKSIKEKLIINRKRQWRKTEDGTHRHI